MSQPVSAVSNGSLGVSNTGSLSGGDFSVQDPSVIIILLRIMSILVSIIGLVAVLASVVTWVMALVQVIKRQDLKEHKLLWVALLLFIGPVGVIAYSFVENRKKLGYYAIAAYVAFPVILVLYAILTFVLQATLG